MAESFDKAKASTDIKHILKMNQIPQDATVESKNKKRVKSYGYGTQPSQHRKHSERSKHTEKHTNSNGNALLDSTDASQPDSAQSVQRGNTNSIVDQSVQKHKKKDTDHSSTTHSESRSTSSAPLPMKYSGNLEVVNSNKRTSSGFKNRENVAEPEFARNTVDPSSFVRKGSNSSYNRNSSAANNQRKNNESLRNGDEETENFVTNREPYRSDSRGDKNHSQMNERRNQIEKIPENHNISGNNSKPQAPELEEEELSEEFLLTLEENGIMVLKKKNPRFAKARYYCDLCDFHLNTKTDCDKHMKENWHSRKKKLNEVDAVLKRIPEPNGHQFAALTTAVDKMYEEHGINEKEKKQRADIVVRLKRMLEENVPDAVIFMYGSSLTGFGLKTADINVNLTSTDKNKKLTLLLKETYLSLKDLTDSGFNNIRSDFTAKIPGFFLMDDLTGLTVHVIIHCYSAHCSSELLSIYSDFDIRVRKLAVAFRYWAHLCGLDQKCDGFIPPQALNLMVIYFLQVLNPQLVPIIQPPKVTGDEIGDYRKDSPGFDKMRQKVMKVSMKSSNDMSVGELWFRLLQFYCLEFDTPNVVVCIHSNQAVPRNSKPWNSKRLAVEDPYMLKRNITRMVNNSRVYEYWEDSIRKALHYFGFPRDTEGKSHISIETVMKITNNETSESCQKTEMEGNKKIVAHNVKVDAGTSKENLSSKKEKHSASIVIASNAIASQKEVTESKDQTQKQKNYQGSQILTGESKISSHSESDGIMDSDDDTDSALDDEVDDDSDFDDAIEQQPSVTNYGVESQPSSSFQAGSASAVKPIMLSQAGSLSVSSTCRDDSFTSQRIDANDICSGSNKNIPDLYVCKSNENSVQSSAESICGQEVACDKNLGSIRALPSSVFGTDNINKADVTDVRTTDSTRLSQSSHSSSEEVIEGSRNNLEFPEEKTNAFSLLAGKDCHYEFSKDFLTDGKGPVLVCTYCEKEGHLKNACPEDKLPEILPLPQLTPFHIKVLSETLNKVPSIVGLNAYGLAERVTFMKDLEEFIQGQFRDANLALFGSSCNGFGFHDSDMDICLTFSHRKVIDKPWQVESLARKMKQCRDLANVQAIPTAKVPIVKFFVRSIRLDGDISLYNILAQHNTKLLLYYSQIDHRVQVLGYTIKNFAKVCDIGDASRGSLSSYAYILMMIYYLQQVIPPVIPVLQELYQGKEKPKLMIEGCDAWFMDDPRQLDKLWPEKGKNKTSVAELWLGFLRFYVEEFNYKELVVSIRQKEPLTRFEKLWNGENIAVEDPFDVSHNLGSGLSRKMNNFIFKTFINGRMLYGIPVDDNLNMFKTYSRPYDYFFGPNQLSENRPPNVHGCRHCGKMGHLARSCPTPQKEKDEQKGLQKQPQQQVKQQPPQQNQASAAQQQKIPPLLQQDTKELKNQPTLPQQQHQSQPTHGSQQQSQLSQPQQQNQPYQQQQKQGHHQQRKSQPSQPQDKQLLQLQQQQESQPSNSPQQRQEKQLPLLPQQQQQSQPSNPPHQQQDKQLSLLPQQQRQLLIQQQSQMQPFHQTRQPPQQHQDRIQLNQKQEQRPPPQQERRQSSQQEERRQPTQHHEQRQPPHQEERRQPTQYHEQRQPLHQEDKKQIPHQDERRQPQPQEDRRQPPQQDNRRQPPQQEERKLHQQERRQPVEQEERKQPVEKQEERRQPVRQEEQRQSPQQQKQRQSFELEQQSFQKERQQKQPFQSQHQPSSQTQQQFRQPPQQPQQETRQPFQQLAPHPQQQHQSHSPQPQQQFSQPNQQHRQSTQPYQQFNPHYQQNSQQKTQPFQHQRQSSQQQLQEQNPPHLMQQWQHPKQQRPPEREVNERDDHRQKGLAGNMNVNSSGPGLPYNNIQAVVPTMMAGMSSQVFHNSSYTQQRNSHHQQHLPGNYRPNIPPISSLGSLPQPLIPPTPRYNCPAFDQRLPPPFPTNMAYPPGFNHAPHNHGSGYPHANYDSRVPHNFPGTHYSGQGNRGHNAGDQFMSPAVQNMFDSARGQVLNDSSDHYYRHK